MNIFIFLFYLGIINIIFGFIWKWVFALPAAILFTFLNFEYGMRFVKVFGSYLLASLTALLTLTALMDNPSVFALILYPIIGAFCLLMAYASNQYDARKEASTTMDWQMIEKIEKDSGFETILTFGVVILYVVILFVPSIATNGLNEWLLRVISWIFNLPIIGLLIGIGGVFFLLNIIFYGLLAMGFITASIVSKFRKEKTGDNTVVDNKDNNHIEKSMGEIIELNSSLDEPIEKTTLKRVISETEKKLNELIEEIEQLKIDLTVVKQEYDAKVGRLYLKLDELDLEILKFKKIEDLVKNGVSFEEAQKMVEETLKNKRKQIDEDYKRIDTEEKEVEMRKDVSAEDKEELKKLWCKLAHKYHPDKIGGDGEMMKKINKAYAEGDLETLRAIDKNGDGNNIEEQTTEELKSKLEGLEISIRKIHQEYELLKNSEWFVLKENIEKANKHGRNILKELSDKVFSDIAEKENKVSKLKNKYG